MPSFRTIRTVPYSAKEMFDLVADIERYPEFLPLCEKTVNRKRKTIAEGVETLFSTMTVGYKAVYESFSTNVTLDQKNMLILCEYVDGPFKYLENRWNFKENGKGCDVEFYITYEFKSFTLGILMGVMFDKVFRRFADVFVSRAEELYGKNR